MTSSDSNKHAAETAASASRRSVLAAPDFSQPAKRIADLVDRPDFPQCALGEHVNIGGVSGVVMEIVRQSLKVQSPEGSVQSFNCNRLRTIYGARPDHAEDEVAPQPVRVEPVVGEPVTDPVPASVSWLDVKPPTAAEKRAAAAAAAAAAKIPLPVRRDFIAEPDFTALVQPIAALAGREDFPRCAYGAHIDIVGYVGVVVELVKDSVKVQSQAGPVRSFNAPMLRKLYGNV